MTPLDTGPLLVGSNRLPSDLLLHLMSPALYCNDSGCCLPAHPIDDALIQFGMTEFGPERILSVRSNLPLEEIPFDSTKKFMATMHDLSVRELSEVVGVINVPNQMIQGSTQFLFL